MKKFKFSLDSVLSYKEQVLESLQGEHAAILARVREQEAVLEAVWRDYRDCNEEYRQRKAEGLSIADAMFYQNGLRVLEAEIDRETRRLEELRRQEEAKLKEHKLEDYHKAVQKAEEALIDEFVSSARARAAIGA